uniref:Uncharacterized protein n=1 Tax=Sipha flava TaxID=143950 RepID=A0A2S2R1E5_9HEMI
MFISVSIFIAVFFKMILVILDTIDLLTKVTNLFNRSMLNTAKLVITVISFMPINMEVVALGGSLLILFSFSILITVFNFIGRLYFFIVDIWYQIHEKKELQDDHIFKVYNALN